MASWGTFHQVGKGRLSKYCDEFAFRYSPHEQGSDRAGVLVLNAEGKRLTYKQPAGTIQN